MYPILDVTSGANYIHLYDNIYVSLCTHNQLPSITILLHSLHTINFAVVGNHEVLNYYAPNFAIASTQPYCATVSTYFVKIKDLPS